MVAITSGYTLTSWAPAHRNSYYACFTAAIPTFQWYWSPSNGYYCDKCSTFIMYLCESLSCRSLIRRTWYLPLSTRIGLWGWAVWRDTSPNTMSTMTVWLIQLSSGGLIVVTLWPPPGACAQTPMASCIQSSTPWWLLPTVTLWPVQYLHSAHRHSCCMLGSQQL